MRFRNGTPTSSFNPSCTRILRLAGPHSVKVGSKCCASYIAPHRIIIYMPLQGPFPNLPKQFNWGLRQKLNHKLSEMVSGRAPPRPTASSRIPRLVCHCIVVRCSVTYECISHTSLIILNCGSRSTDIAKSSTLTSQSLGLFSPALLILGTLRKRDVLLYS